MRRGEGGRCRRQGAWPHRRHHPGNPTRRRQDQGPARRPPPERHSRQRPGRGRPPSSNGAYPCRKSESRPPQNHRRHPFSDHGKRGTRARGTEVNHAAARAAAMNKLRSRLEVNLGALLLLILLAGCLLVLRPFVSALLWAVVLCFSSWPIYRRLLGWLGNRRTLAALAMTLAMVLIVLLPFLI